MKELTREEAIAFGESKKYEGMSAVEIAEFQLNQAKLCMPFEVFQNAVMEALGRPVFTHEFADAGRLRCELSEKHPAGERK